LKGDFRIGEWVVHPHLNSLECNGETVHLEPKVMQVLLTLAAEPGEVVTREHVRNTVWSGVFVGEDVLIRAISEIRRAFSDDPRSPHTIQTIPKVGYRLIAQVVPAAAAEATSEDLIAEASNVSTRSSADEASLSRSGFAEPKFLESKSLEQASLEAAAESKLSPARPGTPSRRRPRSRLLWAVLWAVCIGLAIMLYLAFPLHTFHRVPLRESYTSRPLTTYPGSELQAAFSPDGSEIAFVWRKTGEQNGRIYIQPLASETPVALTAGLGDETSPAWSPDGHFIAFIRQSAEWSSVIVVPSMGGSEHEVYRLPTNSVWEYGGLAWTSDGGGLIFPQQETPQAPSELVELTLKDRSYRTLTRPPDGWAGDWTPILSPDGSKLAFGRGPNRSARDIYLMTLPDGKPQQLTHDGRLIVGLTWSADGSSIVFSSNRGGSLSLWRVAATGGVPEHETAGGDDAYGPSIARQGNRLVYSHGNAIWSILAAEMNHADAATTAREILTSSEQDASPHVSPSGGFVAFQSWRSGSQEIWTSAIDGSNPVQLTSAGSTAGSPTWSPDGRRIAFDARPSSFAHIYVIDAVGGAPRAITSGNYNDIVPSWSSDGKSIYFGSNRSGSWQIWKIAADGSLPPQQISRNGGMVALEGAGARFLYFTKFEQAGIWECPVAGGAERMVFRGPPADSSAYWTLHSGKIYSLLAQEGRFEIQQVDPATGQGRTVYVMKHAPTPFAGVSVTPDGKRILFAELTQASSDLMLVEHFQ
jgi:Tol biopolymer transport system component/DNA-binding winged helix-turn-helix (wHTH) protein